MLTNRPNSQSDQSRISAERKSSAPNLNTSFGGDPVNLDEPARSGTARRNSSVQQRGAEEGGAIDHWQVIKRADNIAAIWANRTRIAVVGGSLSFLVGATMWSGNIYAAIPWAIPTAFFGVVAWGVLPAVVEPTVRAVYKRRHLPGNEST